MISIRTIFKKPLRFLIALALLTYILLFFLLPSSFPVTIRSWAPSAQRPAAEHDTNPPLSYIDPLIGTINGGETGAWQQLCLAGRV